MGRRELLALALVGLLALVAGCASEAPSWVRSGDVRFGDPVTLPAPDVDGEVSLEAAIAGRRSARSFGEEPLGRDVLGQLLWAGQGVTGRDGKRSTPSAGGLNPLELYVVTPEEVLHYLPDGHRAEVRAADDLRPRLQEAALDQRAVGFAPAVLVVAAVPTRTEAKYGARGEDFVEREAGHATQNMLLQATALGLEAVPIGGIDPDAVEAVLSLPSEEEVLYLVPVGRPV
jgi:SagB-type dehydrogenase family enzyme